MNCIRTVSVVMRLTCLFLLILTQTLSADDTVSALPAQLASQSLLLDATSINSTLFAVGERGHVLKRTIDSDWQQIPFPGRALLTRVWFKNPQLGWITGHDASLFMTTDGGENWKLIYEDQKLESPLFDIRVFNDGSGIAIGAYGLILHTSDHGKNWQMKDFVITNAEPDLEFFDYHLHRLAEHKDGSLFIVAEAGYIFHSTDKGQTWRQIESPYHGSLFAISIVDDALIIAGLRGNVFRSENGGESWQQIDIASNELITQFYLASDKNLYALGHAGTLMISQDNGQSFIDIPLQQQFDFTAMSALGNQYYLFGEMGSLELSTMIE